MKFLKYYDQFSEGLFLSDDELKFDPLIKDKTLNTKLGKSNFQIRETTLSVSQVKVYSVFAKLPNKDESEISSTEVLKILKGQSQKIISEDNLDKLLDRAANFMYFKIQNNPIDLFITLDSSSNLSIQFLNHILKRIPYTVKVFEKAIKKVQDFSNIYYEKPDWLTDKTEKSIQNIINNIKKTNILKIFKFDVKTRKLIHGWLELDSNILNKIQGKNICLVDDYLTSGSTFEEAIFLLKQYSPKNIFCITLLKNN